MSKKSPLLVLTVFCALSLQAQENKYPGNVKLLMEKADAQMLPGHQAAPVIAIPQCKKAVALTQLVQKAGASVVIVPETEDGAALGEMAAAWDGAAIPDGWVKENSAFSVLFYKAVADRNLPHTGTSALSQEIDNGLMRYDGALADMDRVLAINPGNVLAYFNRASYFIEMERWDDALADYNKAIELYPDFAKAYMNRAYVELQLGMNRASKEDYRTARKKVAEYEKATASGADFSDTTKKYSSLLALDADFARNGGFEDEMLRHRDVDINLKPLYRFVIAGASGGGANILQHRYENKLLDTFMASLEVPVEVSSGAASIPAGEDLLQKPVKGSFEKGLQDMGSRQYSKALGHFTDAVEAEPQGPYDTYYKAFYLMNRAALRAEMIEFIASFESNVQTLTMDDKGNTRARVREQVTREYDYSEALQDMEAAAAVLPSVPYIQFNLGNLYCLSSRFVQAIESYDKAIKLYPWMGDAYFNRGLVLIYLKDREKGCIDLSRAGELGVEGAYGVISRYCDKEERP